MHPICEFEALAKIGAFAKTIAPKKGNALLAAFLKKLRRDCNSSFSFSFMIGKSFPIDSPDWVMILYKKKRESLYLLLVPLYKALALPINVERATRSLTLYDNSGYGICLPQQ